MTELILANYSNMSSLNNILAIPNSVTGDFFYTGMIWMMFFIVLMITIRFGFEIALVGSSFLGLMLGIIFLFMGLVTYTTVGIFIGLLIFSIIWFSWANSQNQ